MLLLSVGGSAGGDPGKFTLGSCSLDSALGLGRRSGVELNGTVGGCALVSN